MNKNLLLIVVVGLIVGVAFFKFKSGVKEEVAESKTGTQEVRKSPPKPPVAGDKLADSSVAKFAFKVSPGELTQEAKIALIGFAITSKSNPDGSMEVVLTPNKSDDEKHVYTVPAGNSLYFVEMSSGDDDEASNYDARLQDDYGLIVNADGIVQ